MLYTPSAPRRVDVDSIIETGPLRGPALLVFLLTTMALVFDGFDVQLVAFAAPLLLKTWGASRAALGPVLAAGLLGMAVGAFALTPYADRHGRKRTIIAALLVVSVGAIWSAHANSLLELGLARLVTGIGLGGSAPNAVALTVDFTPRRHRNLLAAIALIGIPIGGLLGAGVAAHVMPVFGWQSVFYIGALLPFVVAVTMMLLLAESPRFLVLAGNRGSELARLMTRIEPGTMFRPDDQYVVAVPDSAAAPGAMLLLSQEFRRNTLLTWLVFVSNIFCVYAMFNWLPTVLSAAGLPLAVALRGAGIFNAGGLLGAAVPAFAMGRFGSRPVLLNMAIAGIVATLAIALVPWQSFYTASPTNAVLLLLGLMTLSGMAMLGLQVAVYSVVAQVHPTTVRSSAVGWAQGWGRLGAIMSSFIGAPLLAMANGVASFFICVGVVQVIALLGISRIDKHVPRVPRP